MQPELSNPEGFPHSNPPVELELIVESPPDTSEVDDCMSKFKNGKCPGTDGIYGEELKYSGSRRLVLYLVLLLGLIWESVTVPSTWLLSSITCLYKKGLRSLAENYRGLSIISTLSKLLSMIIVGRIRTVY